MDRIQRGLKGFEVLWDTDSNTIMLASPIRHGIWEWDEEHQAFVGVALCREVDIEPCPNPPNPACTCGIYAVYDLDGVISYSALIGLVRPAGRVIPGEKGWRAEKAYVEGLAVLSPLTSILDYLPLPLRDRLMPIERLLEEREVPL